MFGLQPSGRQAPHNRGVLAELPVFGRCAGHTNAIPQGRRENAGTSRPSLRYPIRCTVCHEIQRDCNRPGTKRSFVRLGRRWACTSVAFFA